MEEQPSILPNELTKMPALPALSEPWGVSSLDSLRLEMTGSIPDKTSEVETRFRFFGFGMVLRGHGTFQAGTGPVQDLRAACVFYIQPGVDYRYKPSPGTSWDERFLCFNGSRVNEWQRLGWLPADPAQAIWPVHDPQSASAQHQVIYERIRSGSPDALTEAKLVTEQLVFHLARAADPGARTNPSAVCPWQKLAADWSARPGRLIDLRETARRLGVGYSTFRDRFRQVNGQSPYQFLLTARINLARQLLSDRERARLSVKEIAYECGFTSQISFQRAFRERTGLSPGAFREECRVWRN